MAKKYIERYNSFKDSLSSLEKLKERDITDDFVISGAVQKFSLTFDISWKVMKDIITNYHGLSDFATGSPRETLKAAKSVGLIKDDIWLDMLFDRNNLVHDYEGLLANACVVKIRDIYIPVFEEFNESAGKIIKMMQN